MLDSNMQDAGDALGIAAHLPRGLAGGWFAARFSEHKVPGISCLVLVSFDGFVGRQAVHFCM